MLIAQRSNLQSIEINAGALHKSVGAINRMPACCNAMNAMTQEGDEIIQAPPKGQGATLTIRYFFPRD